MAPVVRITDTDVMPVADSDDSIDVDRGRLPPELILDGGIVLPLDGKIEDSAMEGRELGETGDTSEEQEPTAQQLQDRLEERFLDTATPCTESRTDGEVNTNQVVSVDFVSIRIILQEEPIRLSKSLRALLGRIQLSSLDRCDNNPYDICTISDRYVYVSFFKYQFISNVYSDELTFDHRPVVTAAARTFTR